MNKDHRMLVLDFQNEAPSLNSDSLESLEEISLNGCSEWVTDDVIIPIISSTKPGFLRSISLFRCWKLTDRAIFHIVKHSNLELLNLSGCLKITDKSLRCIGRFGEGRIRHLDLTRCPDVTDLGINYLSSLNSTLEILILYADSQLGQSAYEAICEFRNLRRLDLCGHGRLSDHSLIAILRNMPNLEYLNLSWCVALTKETVEAIVTERLLSKIHTVSFFGIQALTNCRKLVEYFSEVPSIRGLDVRGIPAISDITDNDCQGLRSILPSVEEWKLHT